MLTGGDIAAIKEGWVGHKVADLIKSMPPWLAQFQGNIRFLHPDTPITADSQLGRLNIVSDQKTDVISEIFIG